MTHIMTYINMLARASNVVFLQLAAIEGETVSIWLHSRIPKQIFLAESSQCETL